MRLLDLDEMKRNQTVFLLVFVLIVVTSTVNFWLNPGSDTLILIVIIAAIATMLTRNKGAIVILMIVSSICILSELLVGDDFVMSGLLLGDFPEDMIGLDNSVELTGQSIVPVDFFEICDQINNLFNHPNINECVMYLEENPDAIVHNILDNFNIRT